MKISIPYRADLEARVRDTVDRIVGSVTASWRREHKADDTHGDINADSIESAGAINVRNDVQATITAWTGTANASLYTANATATQASAALLLTPEDPDNTSGFAAAAYPPIGADPPRVVFATGPGVLAYELDKGIRERSRTVAMGEWQTQSFNAGNFTGTGGMTVTVDSGDVSLNRWTIVGKTMTWTLNVGTFTLATANGNVSITIPGGFTAAQTGTIGTGICSNNGASFVQASVSSVAAASVLSVTPIPAFQWTGAGTNNNHFSFTVSFEVQ